MTLLHQKISSYPTDLLPWQSRIHPLNTIVADIKRDDELSFGISGSKMRKYRTLLPYLQNLKVQEAVLIGGAQSNHLVGLCQLLIERGIKPTLFLRGSQHNELLGNQFLLNLLITKESMHWISRQDWPNVNALADKYAQNKSNTIVIPEGGALFPSLIGSMSLTLDLEKVDYDTIYCDSGTGISAIALLLSFAYLKKRTHIHILLVAGNEQEFMDNLWQWHAEFEEWMGISCPKPQNFTLHLSENAKSFGSVNQTLITFIKDFIKKEGVFIDPIYMGKLFYFVKQHVNSNLKNLIIHSGGGFALFGFENSFKK
ncbi:MAG: hypothetical protein JHC93_04695 [Parachlamydiales bacterium]|nr:hypothetical protein [Parachlamydiales bacterium]